MVTLDKTSLAEVTLRNGRLATSKTPVGGADLSAVAKPKTIVISPFAFAETIPVLSITVFKLSDVVISAAKFTLVLSNLTSNLTNPTCWVALSIINLKFASGGRFV